MKLLISFVLFLKFAQLHWLLIKFNLDRFVWFSGLHQTLKQVKCSLDYTVDWHMDKIHLPVRWQSNSEVGVERLYGCWSTATRIGGIRSPTGVSDIDWHLKLGFDVLLVDALCSMIEVTIYYLINNNNISVYRSTMNFMYNMLGLYAIWYCSKNALNLRCECFY